MNEPTDLEKKSLEAHVDLCAQRYRFLETKIETLQSKLEKLTETIEEVYEMVQEMSDKRSKQLISWQMGIIASMATAIGVLLITYVFK